MIRSTRFALPALLATAMTVPQAASLAKDHDQDAARAALSEGKILPLTDILAVAAKHEPGTVIKVELEAKHQLIYKIKVLTAEGRVRELKIDARTGAILKVEDD